jgi:predicted RNA-binding protein with RPS1 domain
LPRRFFTLSDEPGKQTKNNKAKASQTNQAQSATAGGGSPKTAAIRLGGNTTKIGLGNARTLELMITGVAVSDLDVDHETGRIVIGLGDQAAKAQGPTAQAKAKPPPAKAKPPPAKAKPPPRQKPPPTAEELADLEDLEVGATLKGKVVGKNRQGCWVDIGKIHEAKVRIPTNVSDKLEWGEELDVTIAAVDKNTARVTVSISEQEQDNIFAREVSKKDVTSFEVGEIVSGYLASTINNVGLFVDVGADKEGLLRRSKSTGSFKRGDKLENLKVFKVNGTKRTIDLALVEDSKGSGDDDES